MKIKIKNLQNSIIQRALIKDAYILNDAMNYIDLIYKYCFQNGNNEEVKGVLLTNVTSNFLSIIRGNGMLYGVRYQTIRVNYSNNYVICF